MDLGSLVSLAWQPVSDVAASAVNVWQAERYRRWAERMSSTAHQREVADLKAAGLNPLLSGGGHGAAVPSASPIPVTSPGRGAVEDYLRYKQARAAAAQERLTDASVDLARAQEAKAREEATTQEMARSLMSAQQFEALKRAEVSDEQMRLIREQALREAAQSRLYNAEAARTYLDMVPREIDKRLYETPIAGEAIRVLEKIGGALGIGALVGGAARGMFNKPPVRHYHYSPQYPYYNP